SCNFFSEPDVLCFSEAIWLVSSAIFFSLITALSIYSEIYREKVLPAFSASLLKRKAMSSLMREAMGIPNCGSWGANFAILRLHKFAFSQYILPYRVLKRYLEFSTPVVPMISYSFSDYRIVCLVFRVFL